MTSKEALNVLLYYATSDDSGFETMKEYANQIEKDLEVLEILKPRVRLKDSTLKNAHFTIDENGLPICENDFKEVDVAFIETSGFVFKNSNEYKLLKEWLENEK